MFKNVFDQSRCKMYNKSCLTRITSILILLDIQNDFLAQELLPQDIQ